VTKILDTVYHLWLKTHSLSQAGSLDLRAAVSEGLTMEDLPLAMHLKTEAQPASKIVWRF